MDNIIEVKNLRKDFKELLKKKRKVLKDISFYVKKGEIAGFLGHNGAGKTTTLKILMGFLKPTSGSISIMGYSPNDISIKNKIGFVPENPVFYKHLKGREILYSVGNMFGMDRNAIIKRTDMLLSLVGLGDKGDIPTGKYSKGMLQRLGMAQALMNDPDLLILDEPLSGLDPVGRKEIRDLIIMQKQRGKTVLFSTHILHDLELIADRIIMIAKGKVIKEGLLSEILEDKIDTIEIKFTGCSDISFIAERSVRIIERGDIYMAIASSEKDAQEIMRYVLNKKGTILSYSPQEISLEKYFLEHLKDTI